MTRYAFALLFVLGACSDAEGGYDAAESGDPPASSEIAEANVDQIADLSRNMLSDVTTALATVSDAEAARAVKPQLAKIAEMAAPLRARWKALETAAATPAAKMAFGQTVMGMMGQISVLSDEFGRLESLPGVRAELEGVMTKIMSFFEPSEG